MQLWQDCLDGHAGLIEGSLHHNSHPLLYLLALLLHFFILTYSMALHSSSNDAPKTHKEALAGPETTQWHEAKEWEFT